MADDRLDPERLKKVTAELVESLTSPEFIEQAYAVRNAPESERLAEASRRLSVQGLREAGVRLPKDMRLSSRYFESSFPVAVELGDYGEARLNIVNELNRVQPGFLDRLRKKHPEVFGELVTVGRSGSSLGLGVPTVGKASWGACAGAGGLSFCGCGGFSV